MVVTTPHHPVVVRLNAQRYNDIQLRVADRITAFAGSMKFVYMHAIVFIVWMLFVEQSPWPTLTLAVSLEAIFLSTFVMIGQNRQGTFQQAKADHDFVEEDQEVKLNTELTRTIHDLTLELHDQFIGQGSVDRSQPADQTGSSAAGPAGSAGPAGPTGS